MSVDERVHHTPHNKKTEEREKMKQHIEKYPKYQRHYSRRHTNLTYLQSHLNITKMYKDYKIDNREAECGSYDLFRDAFNETGYKFKKPQVDTCKTCDIFMLRIKQSKDKNEQVNLQKEYDEHKDLADLGYLKKKR